jgi:uncharacterized protein (TIGR02996 family)
MTEARLPGGLPARPEGLALWREILDRPGEDLPRRIFADWMADNGDPARAEFVHSRLDRASLPAGDPRAEELFALEEATLAIHGPSWEAEFSRSMRQKIEYRRGLAEVFTADADALPTSPLSTW